jgi:hypothetical protein
MMGEPTMMVSDIPGSGGRLYSCPRRVVGWCRRCGLCSAQAQHVGAAPRTTQVWYMPRESPPTTVVLPYPYAPDCLEGKFSEVELPIYGVLRSSA